MSSIPASGRSPRGRHGNPLQYSCLENLHGQRSLEGHSLWDHKQSDTTEGTSHAYTQKNKSKRQKASLSKWVKTGSGQRKVLTIVSPSALQILCVRLPRTSGLRFQGPYKRGTRKDCSFFCVCFKFLLEFS